MRTSLEQFNLSAPDTFGAWRPQDVCIYEGAVNIMHPRYYVPGWCLLCSSLPVYLRLRKVYGWMLPTYERIGPHRKGIPGKTFIPAQGLGDESIKCFYCPL